MKFSPTAIDGCYVIDLEKRGDERGYFARAWCEREFAEQGLVSRVSQVNVGVSTKAGTLRGMHYQRAPHAEVKVVSCLLGVLYDVALDLRPRSPTFRRWFGVELSPATGRMLYIAEGCAHGYQTLADDTHMQYLTSAPYAPGHATGVRFDDPAFGIQWPAPITVVSDADKRWPDYRAEGNVQA